MSMKQLHRCSMTSLLPILFLAVCSDPAARQPNPPRSPKTAVDSGQPPAVIAATPQEPSDCSQGEIRIHGDFLRADESELMQCIGNGHTWRAMELIESDADLSYTTRNGETAMSFSVRAGDVVVLQELAARGVPIPTVVNGAPPLAMAVLCKDTAMSRVLLEFGADPNADNYDEGPIFSFATASGDTTLVRLFLDHGADVHLNPQGEFSGGPPLVQARTLPVIEMLLDAGADVNLPDWYHRETLLWRAACSPDRFG